MSPRRPRKSFLQWLSRRTRPLRLGPAGLPTGGIDVPDRHAERFGVFVEELSSEATEVQVAPGLVLASFGVTTPAVVEPGNTYPVTLDVRHRRGDRHDTMDPEQAFDALQRYVDSGGADDPDDRQLRSLIADALAALDLEVGDLESIVGDGPPALDTDAWLPRDGSGEARPLDRPLRIVPHAADVEFAPGEETLVTEGGTVEFEMRVSESARSRSVVEGGVSLFDTYPEGELLVGHGVLSARVSSELGDGEPAVRTMHHKAYRSIFASYSHDDEDLVRLIGAALRACGDSFIIDRDNLRAGEDWWEGVQELIRNADVFQLFWSQNSMRSSAVRREWEYALGLGREAFVRPLYWERPMPSDAGLPPDELKRLHFGFFDLRIARQAGG